jgi:type IV secretory pathway VirB2 component (pilin)
MKAMLSRLPSPATLALRLSADARGAQAALAAAVDRLDAQRQTAFVSMLVLMTAAAPANAQNAGGQGSVTTFLQNIVNLITGTTGQLLAVIAVAIAGVAALFGAISIRALGGVVIGVLLIFSSGWIVDQIVA